MLEAAAPPQPPLSSAVMGAIALDSATVAVVIAGRSVAVEVEREGDIGVAQATIFGVAVGQQRRLPAEKAALAVRRESPPTMAAELGQRRTSSLLAALAVPVVGIGVAEAASSVAVPPTARIVVVVGDGEEEEERRRKSPPAVNQHRRWASPTTSSATVAAASSSSPIVASALSSAVFSATVSPVVAPVSGALRPTAAVEAPVKQGKNFHCSFQFVFQPNYQSR